MNKDKCGNFIKFTLIDYSLDSEYSNHTEVVMSNDKFNNSNECKFEISKRDIQIREKFAQYYKDTPSGMNNKDALPLWKTLMEWCRNNHCTEDEINKSKLLGISYEI